MYSAKGVIKGFVTGVLFVAFVYGLYHSLAKILSSEGRRPAAIDRNHLFDLSYLDEGALKAASAKLILKNADVFLAENNIGVSLGHFISRSEDGRKQFLCEKYDHVTLTFEADGMAVGGERPKLVVEAPCLVNEDLNKMSPILIPYRDIIRMPASDGELSFGEHKNHYYKLHYLSGQWPDQWVLAGVRLDSKKNPAEFLQLDRRDVYKYSSKPIVMIWAK